MSAAEGREFESAHLTIIVVAGIALELCLKRYSHQAMPFAA